MLTRFISRHPINIVIKKANNAGKWLAKAILFTTTGAVLNGATSAITGLTGGNTKTTVDLALQINTLGGALLGGIIGFSEATPLSTSIIITRLTCNQPQCAIFGLPFFICLEIISGLFGNVFLDEDLTNQDIASYSLVGSFGAIVFIGVIGYLLQKGSNQSLLNYLSHHYDDFVNYLNQDSDLITDHSVVAPDDVIINIAPPIIEIEAQPGPQP